MFPGDEAGPPQGQPGQQKLDTTSELGDPIVASARDTMRTSYGRRIASYWQRLDHVRQQLTDLGPASPHYDVHDQERRQLLAELDEVFVSAAPLRSADPQVRRLRAAQRRADRREAS